MSSKTCSKCSGSGQVATGTDSDGMFSYSMCSSCHGTGRQATLSSSLSSNGNVQRTSESKEAVDKVSDLCGLIVFGLIAYYGMYQYQIEWYWSVGLGILFGFTVQKILSGPLRSVIDWVIKLLVFIIVTVLILTAVAIFFGGR